MGIVGLILALVYFVIGLIQLVAIMDGIIYATDLGVIFAGIIAFIITYIPIISTILGIYGAVMAWEWNLFLALLLFFWPVPIAIFFAITRYRDY
ncbi:MAG: hypothetical protein F4073_11210 [Rhodobacteraceae bacterium]|nr:hypothetical protein [Gemmatimonadota bacterium]MYF46178.1 hypothetical protein [Paracoccaceae bacterium]MYI92501.1 hypothetical protein [Paracoccaceae bacterium]